jgi:hypothetical protein
MVLEPSFENYLTIYVRASLWAVYLIPLVYPCHSTGPYCFDYCSFVVSFEIGKHECSNFTFCLKIILALWGPLRFHMNFRVGFSIIAKGKSASKVFI